jgi:hypothetical protein
LKKLLKNYKSFSEPNKTVEGRPLSVLPSFLLISKGEDIYGRIN